MKHHGTPMRLSYPTRPRTVSRLVRKVFAQTSFDNMTGQVIVAFPERVAPYRGFGYRLIGGIVDRIRAWLERAGLTARLRIQVRPLEQDWWYGGWFAPAADKLNSARQALRRYRDETFPKDSAKYSQRAPFPWRYKAFSATGLPGYLRGWLDVPPRDAKEASGSAEGWLDAKPTLIQALLGEKDWRPFFPNPPQTVVSHPQPDPDQPGMSVIGKLETSRRISDKVPASRGTINPRFHVHYQQWHGKWPVFAGQLSVHLSQGDHRVSVTSSYLPVPPEKAFELRISEEEAWHNARLAMQHHAPQGRLVPISQFLCRLLGRTSMYDDWSADTRRYEDSDLVVLPFAGDYRLAYEIHLTSPDRSETWSIFVDAETGVILGRPRNLACHAYAYASSEEVLDPGRPGIVETWNTNPCGAFMDVTIYDGDQPTCQVPATWPCDETGGPAFEATNVTIHALRLYNDFVQFGADVTELRDPARRLTARVATPDYGILDMGFNPSTRLITFQQQAGEGLLVEEVNKRVYHPAHDPELVYHEVAHGLMWLLNPDPFENLVEAAPFACSLVEGYANYFGRSLGSGQAASPPEPWAKAAYRTDDWDDRWALDRSRDTPSQDVLAVPGLYPQALATGLIVYDVGMIWARALWDLRQIVGQGIADDLALEASMYACGWVTSFEIVAEGLVDAAAKSTDIDLDEALLPLLAARNLLTEQGIQALAKTTQAVVVGADAGVMRFQDGTWQLPADEEVQQGDGSTERLTNVVALDSAGDDAVYAATETGVYRRGSADTHWHPVRDWPAAQRPLALAVGASGDMYVGTAQGVWMADGSDVAPAWSPVNPTDTWLNGFSGLALDVALGPTTLFVAGYNALWVRALAPNAEWRLYKLQDEKTDLVTCVEARDGWALVGTGNAGIWQCISDANGSFVVGQIAATDADLDGAAVLSLAVTDTEPLTVYAGTSKGIYKGHREEGSGEWTWDPVSNSVPEGAIVTRLLSTTNGLYAGTAQHGLWQQSGANWSQVTQVQQIAVAAIQPVSDTDSATFTVAAPAGISPPEVCLHPFHLIQPRKIQISVVPAPAEPVQLWWMELNVKCVAITPVSPSDAITADVQDPGFYAILIRNTGAYTATIRVSDGA